MKTTKKVPQKISNTSLIEKIKENKGKFFTITFRTVKGETRTINCNRTIDEIQPTGFLVVYSVHDKGIRKINLRNLVEATIGGNYYIVK